MNGTQTETEGDRVVNPNRTTADNVVKIQRNSTGPSKISRWRGNDFKNFGSQTRSDLQAQKNKRWETLQACATRSRNEADHQDKR